MVSWFNFELLSSEFYPKVLANQYVSLSMSENLKKLFLKLKHRKKQATFLGLLTHSNSFFVFIARWLNFLFITRGGFLRPRDPSLLLGIHVTSQPKLYFTKRLAGIQVWIFYLFIVTVTYLALTHSPKRLITPVILCYKWPAFAELEMSVWRGKGDGEHSDLPTVPSCKYVFRTATKEPCEFATEAVRLA